MIADDADREQALRAKAVRQLKKQRDFRSHVLVYVLVNTLLVAGTSTAARRSPRTTSSGRCTT